MVKGVGLAPGKRVLRAVNREGLPAVDDVRNVLDVIERIITRRFNAGLRLDWYRGDGLKLWVIADGSLAKRGRATVYDDPRRSSYRKFSAFCWSDLRKYHVNS
jgi:hypothetical protein